MLKRKKFILEKIFHFILRIFHYTLFVKRFFILFKGKSIDAVVETIYDAFYEALADGQDIPLLQTDFCKAYDYVNCDALIYILKRLKASPQAIFVIEKVLHPSKTWLPSIEGKPGFSLANSITSRTGV